MALINCPECSRQISDKSKNCIHCGFPINESEPAPEKEPEPSPEAEEKSSYKHDQEDEEFFDEYDEEDEPQTVEEIEAKLKKENREKSLERLHTMTLLMAGAILVGFIISKNYDAAGAYDFVIAFFLVLEGRSAFGFFSLGAGYLAGFLRIVIFIGLALWLTLYR